MSSLIIGSAFVIAILAIIGLVYLIRSGPSTPKLAQTAPQPVQEAQGINEAAQEANKVTQAAQAAQGGLPVQTMQPEQPAAEEETIPQDEEPVPSPEPVQRRVQYFPIASGQFHSLSVELRALHSQAQEIEQRINNLTDVIERVESDQNHYVSLDSQERAHEIENASKN